jgi:AraC-like DNA-binding protein
VIERIPNTYLRQFFRFLGSRESLLRGTAETPATLAQLDGSNSFRDYCRFFRNARVQLGRPEIGPLLGRVNQLANMHGPVSTVLFHSLDIGDCLQLLVNREDADYRIGTDTDPDLRSAAIRRCEALRRGVLGARSTDDRIRQIFADNPGHLWTLKDIARHLSVSARTLQRRLARENTSYQLLHDRCLRDEARQLLGEKNVTTESIALLLGYSDVSNFRHACRRWFGCSPQDCRRRQALGVSPLQRRKA